MREVQKGGARHYDHLHPRNLQPWNQRSSENKPMSNQLTLRPLNHGPRYINDMASARGVVNRHRGAIQGQHPLNFSTREGVKCQACLCMGGHDDETASARGIVAGGEDNGMQHLAIPGENIHKFCPGHLVSAGMSNTSQEETYLIRSKGKPRT